MANTPVMFGFIVKVCQYGMGLFIAICSFRAHCIASLFSCILHRMQINLISVGNRMPGWVQQGYDEYAKRLPRECELVLKEIAPGKRTKNSDVARIIKEEGERMITSIPQGAHIVTLDIPGKSWTTPELAQAMKRWLESGQNVSLLIGGPEGLADSVKQLARESWSLSPLTFPHPLVRIVVAEQLYRAWTILHNHPYHRQ
jgi:23S rRNA (pseudouridine1915-N3)-methyltransferase